MALLDTRSPVTAVKLAELLSDLRTVDNESLALGNNEGSNVESVRNLGNINVKILKK